MRAGSADKAMPSIGSVFNLSGRQPVAALDVTCSRYPPGEKIPPDPRKEIANTRFPEPTFFLNFAYRSQPCPKTECFSIAWE